MNKRFKHESQLLEGFMYSVFMCEGLYLDGFHTASTVEQFRHHTTTLEGFADIVRAQGRMAWTTLTSGLSSGSS